MAATKTISLRSPAVFPNASRTRVHLPTDTLDAHALEELAATLTELARSMRERQGPAPVDADETVEVVRILGLIGYEMDRE